MASVQSTIKSKMWRCPSCDNLFDKEHDPCPTCRWSKYPEHEKLHQVKDKSQAIGEFLDWLGNEREPRAQLCELVKSEDTEDYEFTPIVKNIQMILAEYFKIDLEKLEKEKRDILDDFRKRAES